MLHFLILLLLIFHAGLHLLGVIKAFELAALPELSLPISPQTGRFWLLATLLLLLAALSYGLKGSWWLLFLGVGLICSQVLIINYWQDAKYGTIANLLLLLVWIIGFSTHRFEAEYRRDVSQTLLAKESTSILTEADMAHLPSAVQQYLHFTGVVGQPKVHDFRVEMHGQMRGAPGEKWFEFTSEQHNSIASPSRLFFMKAQVKGLPTAGYHAYHDQGARMLIKALSLFPVVDIQSPTLYKAETVTFFNDMCLMAPATLIDPRISWEEVSADQVRATFRNGPIQIQVILVFTPEGKLVNFFSEDRFDVNTQQQLLFSTPIHDYQDINGLCLPAYGEAVWHYPEQEFNYGQFHIRDISYNLKMNNTP